MPNASRLAFGDHRDPREEIDALFATPDSQDGDRRAADWAHGVVERAGIPAGSTVEVIAALRTAEPRLGLKSATYLAESLAR